MLVASRHPSVQGLTHERTLLTTDRTAVHMPQKHNRVHKPNECPQKLHHASTSLREALREASMTDVASSTATRIPQDTLPHASTCALPTCFSTSTVPACKLPYVRHRSAQCNQAPRW